MKLRVEVVVEDHAGQEMQRIVVMDKFCNTFEPVGGRGVSLADGKDLPGAVQQHVLQAQVNAFSSDHSHRHHDQMFSPGLGHSRLRREGYFHPVPFDKSGPSICLVSGIGSTTCGTC